MWRKEETESASIGVEHSQSCRPTTDEHASVGAVDRQADQPYADDNYRSIGLADMALAIRRKRPHGASGELALHVLEVMEGFETSSSNAKVVEMTTSVERPAPLSLTDGRLLQRSEFDVCVLAGCAEIDRRTSYADTGRYSP